MLCSIVQSNDDVERGRRPVNKWRKPFECYWNYIDCMPRWIQGGTKKIVLVNQIPIEKTYTTWWPKVFQSKISQFTLKKGKRFSCLKNRICHDTVRFMASHLLMEKLQHADDVHLWIMHDEFHDWNCHAFLWWHLEKVLHEVEDFKTLLKWQGLERREKCIYDVNCKESGKMVKVHVEVDVGC